MTDANHPTVSAIVLAGGRSSRFGTDKLSADVEGSPLLHHAIRAVATVSDEVLIAGAVTGLATGLPDDIGVPMTVVRDTEPDMGPLVALLATAREARGDVILVVGGDMPELQAPLLRRLLTWDGGQDGVCLIADGWTQPLPVALDRGRALTSGDALRSNGVLSLRRLIESLRVHALQEHEWRAIDPAGDSLRDIDTPGDFERVSSEA